MDTKVQSTQETLATAVVRSSVATVRRYALLATLVWTAVGMAGMFWNIEQSRTEVLANARIGAKAFIEKDLAFRRWATRHGGVYVRPTKRTPPNPYLKVPDRDVVTTGGIALTLMNPAYITREVQTEFAEVYGVIGHLTSLDPLNPVNSPDEWERTALEHFALGEKEAEERRIIEGQPFLRLMRPVYMEKGCQACHEEMGLKVGDVRGGIAISVPLDPYQRIHDAHLVSMGMTYLIVWASGLLGIGAVAHHAYRYARERQRSQEQLHRAYDEMERRVAERTREWQNANDALRDEIDKRMHSEASLRASDASLSALIDSTDGAIWSVDTEFRLIRANAAFHEHSRQLGGRVGSAGERVFMLDEEDPIRQREWLDYYQRALGGESFSVETELKVGEEKRWHDYRFSPIRSDHGEVVGATVYGRDITDRMRSELEVRRHHREAMLLNHLNDLLQSCEQAEEAYHVIAMVAEELFSVSAATIAVTGALAVTEGEDRQMRTVARWGGPEPRISPEFQRSDCWALRRGQVHEVDGPQGLPCRHFREPPAGGYVCQPLVVRGELFGLLHLAAESGAISRRQRELAESVGEAIKLALSNLRLREALKDQATHDPLTGLFNRRYLADTLPRDLHHIRRNGETLCVAMLDIDHFKRFNDSFGHEAGDAVLRAVGDLLRKNLRKSDLACRYGGEEILLIFRNLTLADAEHRVEALRQEIKSLKVPVGGEELPAVSVSAGLAQAPDHGSDADSLLHAADRALYLAKNAGRDRLVIYSPIAVEPSRPDPHES